MVQRHALIFMVGHAVDHQHGGLGQGQQTPFLGGDRHAGRGMEMHDTAYLGSRHVYGAVDGKSGWVHRKRALVHHLSLLIHLDQRGGGHLIEQHPQGVEQEVMRLPRKARRKMGENQIIPAVVGHQSVGSRQIHPDAPFCFTHVFTRREPLSPASAVEPSPECFQCRHDVSPPCYGPGIARYRCLHERQFSLYKDSRFAA